MIRTTLITAFVALVALSGCNTVAGVGEDVQAGGAAIADTAETVKTRNTTTSYY